MKTLKTIILLLCFIVILSSLYLAIVIPSLDIAKTVILSVISIICFIISFVIIENFNK